jgi:SprT protein
MKKDLREGLSPYLPDRSLEIIMGWLGGKHVSMRISRGRRSKLGDYRPPVKDDVHSISVNGDLNPFEFLLTLTHEIAHMVIWEKYGRRSKPHGIAWKKQYALMLGLLIEKDIFPLEIQSQIRKQVDNPRANSKSNTELVRALHSHNPVQTGVFLEDIPHGAIFSLKDGRKFRKEEKLRKWYRCISQQNRKAYRISPVTRVLPVES